MNLVPLIKLWGIIQLKAGFQFAPQNYIKRSGENSNITISLKTYTCSKSTETDKKMIFSNIFRGILYNKKGRGVFRKLCYFSGSNYLI